MVRIEFLSSKNTSLRGGHSTYIACGARRPEQFAPKGKHRRRGD